MEVLRPEWPVKHAGALMTTAALGNVVESPGCERLRALVPAEPRWLYQVHGATVVDVDTFEGRPQADAAVARRRGTVCIVKTADCLPVLFADDAASVVAAAHAGWRGLAAGVLEATVRAARVPPERLCAWLGAAIGAQVYEVGDEVRLAIGGPEAAFRPTRPGHWLLDLYAVARHRLRQAGIERIYGGGHCTYSERERFFSYRRDRGDARMAAAIWLA